MSAPPETTTLKATTATTSPVCAPEPRDRRHVYERQLRVVVIEPDPLIAKQIYAYVSKQPKYVVVGIARSVKDGVNIIANTRPHLLILDLDLDGDDGIVEGLELVRQLRTRGSAVDVVALSAVSKARLVRAAVQLGVIDFVVKPFQLERLRQALAVARRRATTGAQDRQLRQDEVDALRLGGQTRWLPRDVEPHRLVQVRAALLGAGCPVTASDVALKANVARTTARRYLEYLVTINELEVEYTSNGRGRPSKAYQFAGQSQVGLHATGRPPVLSDAG
ncbi:MAG: two-component system, CitB family, response regulator DctR [Solirubrobacteraceae bacterium]|jgi:response regulator of citrate/malate metabolism|nr:two-component system, CitB family, response regulator DctR [Solirubrobacteraceae bacterium]